MMQRKHLLLVSAFLILAVVAASAQQMSNLAEFPRQSLIGKLNHGLPLPSYDQFRPEDRSLSSHSAKSGHNEVDLIYEGSTLWSGVNDLVVQGNYAYCATMQGLLILDIADPASPRMVSQFYFPQDRAEDIAVVGNFAYVTGWASGLYIIDISNPHSPSLVGRYGQGNACWHLAVSGNLAYVTSSNMLQIIDISTPSSPLLVGEYFVPNYAADVQVSDSLAYVSDYYGGLLIINVSVPYLPQLVAQYWSSSYINRIAISGSYAYLAKCPAGIEIVNISDPSYPQLEGNLDTPGSAYDIKVIGELAYVADGNECLVMNVGDPNSPYLLGTCSALRDAYALAVSGNHAFVTGWQFGVNIVDVAIPSSPSVVGSYGSGRPVAVAVSGKYAYVADNDSGFRIIDIADPSHPTPISKCCYSGSDVAVSGSFAYMTDYSSLEVIDITNPYAPVQVGNYYDPNWYVFGVSVLGRYAYLAAGNWNGGLLIVDIINPQSPTPVGSCSFPGYSTDVAVVGNYAYVTSYSYQETSSIQVVDIRNPQSPVVAGSCATPGAALGVAVRGSYCYVADWNAGMQVVDIANPTNPHIVANYTSEFGYGGPRNVVVHGINAYIAYTWGGVEIVNVADPRAPHFVGRYVTPGWANGIAVAGDQIYVTDEICFSALSISICGDIDGDAAVDISDAVAIISYIFAGALPKHILGSGDVDCSGAVDIADAVYLINYIFWGGPMPGEGCRS